MSYSMYSIAGLSAGMLMGYLYFRGLWWTVQRVSESRNPYGLILLSFVVRTAFVMAGFYLLLLFRWEAMAVGLIGFIAIRFLLVRRWGLNSIQVKESREVRDGVEY